MKSKIFRSTFLVAGIVFLSCIVLFLGVLHEYFGNVQRKQLQSELALAKFAVEGNGLNYLEKLEKDDERLTLIDADGKVLYDSWADASELENHSGREEVKEALETGEGTSSRYSATFTEETIYYAVLLSSGDILRISATRLTMLSLLLGMSQPICIIIAMALVLSGLLAFRIANQIAEPLNNLDLEKPLENDTYDEIAPLLTKIEQGKREISQKKEELEEKEEEFDAVTQNMDEGLVLINHRHEVMSINPAAQAYYDTNYRAVGKSFLMMDRSQETGKLLEDAEKNGKAEIVENHKGREYQIHASRIRSGNMNKGIALLIFDITEKAFAERNRKEFTANVTHELKSPLHSIMGSAELIEQGMVESKDMPDFVGTIRKEAERLVTLIDDIIRLSELDEKTDLPMEEICLKESISEIIKPLILAAEKKNVPISVTGDEVKCVTSRQLLTEIIYNLCDNAVKYNKEGGSVTVATSSTENMAEIRVSDTGIGIPPEHQSRIFERFYRADKSHSRESGGTGLGLSIVKHAVQYLGGSVTFKSADGNGTCFLVKIPLLPGKG